MGESIATSMPTCNCSQVNGFITIAWAPSPRAIRRQSVPSKYFPPPEIAMMRVLAKGNPAAALLYQAGPRLELLARRAGIAYREPEGLYRSKPDSGWAKSEVSRLIALGVPEASVYGVHWTSVVLPVFRAELARRGIVVTDSLVEKEAVALRLRFPVSGAPPLPSRTAPP